MEIENSTSIGFGSHENVFRLGPSEYYNPHNIKGTAGSLYGSIGFPSTESIGNGKFSNNPNSYERDNVVSSGPSEYENYITRTSANPHSIDPTSYGSSKHECSGHIILPILSCYHEKKEGGCEMSLVGVIKSQFGAVAFADDRSSYIINGISYPKGSVQKLFRGGNFLFVAHGVNEFPTPKGVIPIEEILLSLHPEDFASHSDYFQRLYRKLKTVSMPDGVYSFSFVIVFLDERENYSIGEYTITNERFVFTLYPDNSIRVAGDTSFLPRSLDVRPDWSVSEMEDYARKLLEFSSYFSNKIFRNNATIGENFHILAL